MRYIRVMDVKNKTAFQELIQEAQPTLKSRVRNLAIDAVVGTVSAVSTGYEVTLGAMVCALDQLDKFVGKVYDATH